MYGFNTHNYRLTLKTDTSFAPLSPPHTTRHTVHIMCTAAAKSDVPSSSPAALSVPLTLPRRRAHHADVRACTARCGAPIRQPISGFGGFGGRASIVCAGVCRCVRAAARVSSSGAVRARDVNVCANHSFPPPPPPPQATPARAYSRLPGDPTTICESIVCPASHIARCNIQLNIAHIMYKWLGNLHQLMCT